MTPTPMTPKRPSSCSTRRATRSAPTASGPCPTGRRSASCASTRGRTPRRRSPAIAFLQEWLKDVDIDSKVTSYESSKLTNIILDGEFDIFEWGWYVEPDPDSMLSYFTCDQRGNWSDSWYCNPEYDKLYLAQNAEHG